MAHFLRRHALDRRTFLRGAAGVSLALPWLEAMQPALSPAAKPPKRAVFIFSPNGMKMDAWTPKPGARKLPLLLEPLEPFKKQLAVHTGLTLDGGRAHGDGPGDHARASASFLTGAHPKKTGGSDIENGVSVDQVLANALEGATPFPSLELGMEGGRPAGVCDSGYSCAYSNNISWKSASTPVTKEVDPLALFSRMFGAPGDLQNPKERAKRRARLRSILDATAEDLKALRRRVGESDRAKLEEYATAVRELEARMERAKEQEAQSVPLPEGLTGGRHSLSFEERLPVMYELIDLALRTDQTRVVTFMLGNAGSNRSYRWLDVPEGHHSLSHHRNVKDNLEKIERINRWHMEQFARFIARLNAPAEGDRPLLEEATVLLGSGLSDGNRHNHEDLPILTVGDLGGTLGTGRHWVHKKETPLCQLHLAILRGFGVREAAFGDADAALDFA